MTPAAISQQIRLLENYLGVPLFHRMTRAIKLTEEARAALPLVKEGFDRLAEAIDRMTQEDETGFLTVSTAPTFAAKWLLQRLPAFSEKYPGIDVRLDASLVPRDFDRDGIDISIRLGRGNYPGLNAVRIFGEEFFPVCSPGILPHKNKLLAPGELVNYRLLHVDWGDLKASLPDWQTWVEAAGIEGIDLGHGPHFTVEGMAIEAAINGDGVGLVSHHAVAEDLKAGRLVRPFSLALPAEFSYWLICPNDYLRRAKVRCFCDWLLQEANKDSM